MTLLGLKTVQFSDVFWIRPFIRPFIRLNIKIDNAKHNGSLAWILNHIFLANIVGVISYLATRWFYKQTHLFGWKNMNHTIPVIWDKCYTYILWESVEQESITLIKSLNKKIETKSSCFMARCIWISPSAFAVNVRPPLSIIALVCPPTFCWVQGKVWLLCQQNELTLQVEGRA